MSCSCTLSVIVVTWNGWGFVEQCLSSLHCQEGGLSTEIIVVDNGSWDGTPDLIRRRFPRVRLIELKSNQGFAKANNAGIRISTGQYICLVNSDVVVPPTCLSQMYSFMEHHPAIGAVGPRMLSQDGHVGRSYMRFPTLGRCLSDALSPRAFFTNYKGGLGTLMYGFDNRTTAEVDVLNGWLLMVRRAAVLEVGGLDEGFFMYGEDIEWCYRLHKAGRARVYFAGAQALHYGGASSAVAPAKFYVAMQEANLRFWRKHYGLARTLAYTFIIGVHQLVRIAGYGAVFLFRASARANAAAKVRRSAACLSWLATIGVLQAWHGSTRPVTVSQDGNRQRRRNGSARSRLSKALRIH